MAMLSCIVCVSLAACGDSADNSGAAGSKARTYADDASTFPALTLTPQQTVCTPDVCALHEPPIYIVKQFGNDLLIGGGRDDIIRVGANGKPVGSIGRRGKGPGEYSFPLGADVDDQGNLTVLDGFRVVRYDAEGKPLETTQLTLPAAPEATLGLQVNGSDVYLLTAHTGSATDTTNVTLQKVAADGRSMTAVAHGRTDLEFKGMGMAQRFFQPLPMVAIQRNGNMYMADGSAYVIRKLDSSGKDVFTLTVNAKPTMVTAADVEAAAAMMRGAPPLHGAGPAEDKAANESASADLDEAVRKAPNVFPVLGWFRVLGDGSLWVRRYTKTRADSARWDAFTAEGEPIGTMTLANVADVRAGSADRILVVDKDSLDYPLIRWMAVSKGK
jgi:hypothetical protein